MRLLHASPPPIRRSPAPQAAHRSHPLRWAAAAVHEAEAELEGELAVAAAAAPVAANSAGLLRPADSMAAPTASRGVLVLVPRLLQRLRRVRPLRPGKVSKPAPPSGARQDSICLI